MKTHHLLIGYAFLSLAYFPPWSWLRGILIERDTNGAFENTIGWYLQPDRAAVILNEVVTTTLYYAELKSP